jgi:hypothetical protein
MKTWMLPLVFPFGLLAAVVLVVVSSPYEAFVAAGAGAVLVPILWRVHFDPAGDRETNYWRIKRQ